MAEIPSDEEIIEETQEHPEEDPEEAAEDGNMEIVSQGAEEEQNNEIVSQGEEQVQWRPIPSRSFTEEYWESKLKLVKISKEDMDKLVMNFLVAEGLVEVAEKFQNESGTKQVEFEIIKDRRDIVKAIQSGNLNDAVEKLTVLNPEILKTNFLLNQQRLIEIIQMGTLDEAIAFDEKELTPFGEQNEEYLKELEKTLTLLVVLCYQDDDPTCPMTKHLTNSKRFETAHDVNAAILTSQTGEKLSKIQYMGQMLIWYQHLLSDDRAEYPYMDVEPENITMSYHKIWYD